MGKLTELAEHWEKECNRYRHGQCMTRRCLFRGGYIGTGPPDYSLATCEEHETAIALRARTQNTPDSQKDGA